MSEKFHISLDGVARKCNATVRPCHYGGASSHYDTLEEAEEAAQKLSKREFGIIPGLGSERIDQLTKVHSHVEMALNEYLIEVGDGTIEDEHIIALQNVISDRIQKSGSSRSLNELEGRAIKFRDDLGYQIERDFIKDYKNYSKSRVQEDVDDRLMERLVNSEDLSK